MMSLTFGLFTQVSGSGPLGPLVSKNSHCDLDIGPRMLKLDLIQDIVILNICVI